MIKASKDKNQSLSILSKRDLICASVFILVSYFSTAFSSSSVIFSHTNFFLIILFTFLTNISFASNHSVLINLVVSF